MAAKQREGYASVASVPLVRDDLAPEGRSAVRTPGGSRSRAGCAPPYSRSNRTGGCSSIVSSKSGPASQRNKRRIHSTTITVRLLYPAESRASPPSQLSDAGTGSARVFWRCFVESRRCVCGILARCSRTLRQAQHERIRVRLWKARQRPPDASTSSARTDTGPFVEGSPEATGSFGVVAPLGPFEGPGRAEGGVVRQREAEEPRAGAVHTPPHRQIPSRRGGISAHGHGRRSE